jgi:hypothetical protein
LNKRIIITQLLLFLSFSVYSFEFGNNLSLGVLGLGVSPKYKDVGWYFFGNVINFTHQSPRGLGVKASPLHFSFNDEGSDVLIFSLTFLNASLFYNFLRNENFILGPFSSIDAVRHNRPGFFELHTGLIFSIRNKNFWETDFYNGNSIIGIDFLTVELGYKYNNKGNQGFYAYIGLDLLTSIFVSLIDYKNDNLGKYRREHPTF